VKKTIKELLEEQGQLVEKRITKELMGGIIEEQTLYSEGFNQALNLVYGKEVDVLEELDRNKINSIVWEILEHRFNFGTSADYSNAIADDLCKIFGTKKVDVGKVKSIIMDSSVCGERISQEIAQAIVQANEEGRL